MISILHLSIAGLALAAQSFAAPAPTVELAERQDPVFCFPPVEGIPFWIQSPGDSDEVWTIVPGPPDNSSIILGAKSSPSELTNFVSAGPTGSNPPFQIVTAIPGSGLCINSPSDTAVDAATCVADQITQQYQFKCQTCNPTGFLGAHCQVASWNFGRCGESAGFGGDIVLGDCTTAPPSQVWDIVQVV